MDKKIAIYNLGQLGVDVVRDATHLDDGAFTTAQNAQVDSVQGIGGIRKRDGMTRLNASALAGSVRGLIGLPLPDRTTLTRTFWLPLNDASSNTFKKSTDGTSWVDQTTPTKAVREVNGGIEVAIAMGDYQRIWQGFADKLYYPGNDYTGGTTAPTLHSWDGTTDLLIATIPDNPKEALRPKCITSLLPYSPTQLLVATADDGTGTGNGRTRILLLDLTSGTMQQIGQETDLIAGHIVGGLLLWQGRIWISFRNANGGIALTTYYARPGDATWTLDDSFGTAHGYCSGLVIFKGNLYQGSGADVGANGLIRKRTTGAVWSTEHTSDGTGAGNYCGPLIVAADESKIFAYRNSVSGGAAPQIRIMESTDGTTWSTSYDISANLSNSYTRSGMPFRDSNGDIYWPLSAGSVPSVGGLLKRTNAGAWSIVLSGLNNVRGALGITYS